jgi:signal transduction histidine kinase
MLEGVVASLPPCAHALSCVIDDALGSIDADRRLLARALSNLLRNAQKYAAGRITLSAHQLVLGGVEIAVEDDGPGIPAAERERIFEPFYRLPGASERNGGVGLGLALVKSITERHGGSVRCEARDGGGSCFVITLPA